MALFRRNKVDQTAVPAELQNYYQAEKRERTGIAWLFAVLTLIATVLVILALFYGGRWTYRKLRPAKAPVTTLNQGILNESADDKDDDGADTATTTTPESTSQPQTSSTSTNTPSTTPAVAGTNTNTSTALPTTGPTDSLAIFVVVSIGAYLAHRRFLSQNS